MPSLFLLFGCDLTEGICAGDESQGAALPPLHVDAAGIVHGDDFSDGSGVDAFSRHVCGELEDGAGGIPFSQPLYLLAGWKVHGDTSFVS